MMLHALESAGIEAHLAGGNVPFLFGALGFEALQADLWIQDERELERARGVIEAYQARDTTGHGSDPGPWTCPSCDEENGADFELCWSCSAPRDAGC